MSGDYDARHGASFVLGLENKNAFTVPIRERKAAEHELQQHSVPILPLARELPQTSLRGLDEHEKAGLLTPRSSYSPRLTVFLTQWRRGAFVARYSGATARDLHPFPNLSLCRSKGPSADFHCLQNGSGSKKER